MNDELLIKYITGQAKREEKEEVLDWIEKNPENRQKFNRLKNAWVFSHLPQQKAAEGDAIRYGRSLRRRRQSHSFLLYGLAATLLLFLFIPLLQKINHYKAEVIFLQNQESVELEYYTNKGVKGQVSLPDGSMVWLNSDSYLKCPGKFTGDQRTVEFSGEGFFEVTKNPDKPMVIKLDHDISVVVRGTRFNLSSYENDNNISALLLSGNITVVRNRNHHQEEIQVKPNEKIYIQKTNKTVHLTIPKETFPTVGWKEGWLVFDETPVSEVLKKLERWHGVSFQVYDPAILNQKFTARFHEESISQILEMMEQVSLLHYKLKEKTATLYPY